MQKKVLVVDDNKSNLMLEKDLLEVAGFNVFVAENATDSIAIAGREIPDIIVMDVVPKPLCYYVRTKRHAISPLFL
jgi:CheY-like chemotaxis protein